MIVYSNNTAAEADSIAVALNAAHSMTGEGGRCDVQLQQQQLLSQLLVRVTQ